MSVMNRRPEKGLFEEVALLKTIDPSFIEKDWWVTQVIAVLANPTAEGFEFVFTGGTALSKAHNLIQRFSEDVDFRVIASTTPQNRRTLSTFKHGVIDALRQSGFAIEDDHIQARDENRFFSIDFDYPSHFSRPDALRPTYPDRDNSQGPAMPTKLSACFFVCEYHYKKHSGSKPYRLY